MSREGEAGVARWLEYATSDLDAAATLLASGAGASAICFLAQQSVRRTRTPARRSSSRAPSSPRSKAIWLGAARMRMAKAEPCRPEDEALPRPEAGTQAQFTKRRAPKTDRYDSSRSTALDSDGQSSARRRFTIAYELGHWICQYREGRPA